MSLYQQIMGADFTRLPSPLQRFHALEGAHVLRGWVVVGAPESAVARMLARCLGAPLDAREGALQFELEAGPAEEVWIRRFPGQMMRSRLTHAGGHVVERLGFARLWFTLKGGPDMLEMKLVRLRFLGVACPRWLLPAIVAEETAMPGRLHFRVQASLPLIGTVASYRGHLDLPDEKAG
ncbi:MAG TPA: DUF4166 domain-containing protein [Ramlibacter sp.]|jgi:hypothetical protein|uniref:DUF4166 domain-containing protein n=1 Tax=Ramlibacter sp. TaxID=1917967 RepID=UPI002D3F5986|nr:DUF4166 domain-containing protein [Ramlibacter sp.]HZY18377.1 DUF4166 domain-containing protein [Ramlibacter sp.]